jgi:predicted metalloprotease with PDZ domain
VARPKLNRPEPPILYRVAMPDPGSHEFHVEMHVPALPERATADIVFPAWAPGSYLVRDFVRHVYSLTITDDRGYPLPHERLDKQRWRVSSGGHGFRVRYRVFAFEQSVRTSFLDRSHGYWNGTSLFFFVDGELKRPCEIAVQRPPRTRWRIDTALPPIPGRPDHFRATDFDELVDSPFEVGDHAHASFTVAGVKFEVALYGRTNADRARLLQILRRVVIATAEMFGGKYPFARYLFIIHALPVGSGGLEHSASVTMDITGLSFEDEGGYQRFADLAAHEFFHAWNVKRLRPVELGPFDYEHENRTRMLWAAEGLTDYYGSLIAVRSGAITPQEYLANLSESISELQTTPGRLSMPVEQASQDAWIRYYRPDENSPNVSISYYTKGAIVGLLLDLEIRRLTNNGKSLDDVMRAAWTKYSGAHGYTPEEFRVLVSEVAGHDLSAWLHRALDTTEELDYAPLATVGLAARADVPDPARPWVGLSTANGTLRNDNGRLVVAQVRRDTPAEAAGVSVEDEILAIGGYRVRPDQWVTRLDAWHPGDTVPLLVARREALVTLQVTFAAEPARGVKVEVDPGADAAADARREAWLKP